MSSVRVTDSRMPPFCWQDKAVLRLIRASFKKSEVATAIAIYTVLTMYASNKQSDEFHLKRQTLCDFVGRSANVVDTYLGRLAELGVIRKEPVAYDNMYRCMNFHLLPLPTVEVSLPTGTPSSADREASPCPQGDAHLPAGKRDRRIPTSEESPGNRNAGPEAPPPTLPPTEPGTPLAERGGGGSAAGGEGAGRLHSGRFRSEAGGSGLILPGEEGPENGRTKKARGRRGAFDLDRHPSDWRPREAVAYFQQRYRQKWPGDGAGQAGAKEGGLIKGMLAWLENEGIGRKMMAEVIDHIFDHWDRGLPKRLSWGDKFPALSLICSNRYFESIMREVQHGVPPSRDGDGGPRHDEYNPESAKRARESADGWGD